MDTDPGLRSKVDSLMAQSWEAWERLGIEALTSGNREFNTPLYRTLVANKKPFLPYEVLELEERITLLEDKANADND